MTLFHAQVHRPFSDEQVTIADVLMISATAIANESGRQPLANTFHLLMREDTIIVETMRSDGREVFARLRFDGQQFILAAEGLI